MTNPAFELGQGTHVSAETFSEREETTTRDTQHQTTTQEANSTGAGQSDSASSDSVATHTTKATAPQAPDIPKPEAASEEVCNKGATYCYDMKGMENGALPNRGSSGKVTSLAVDSPLESTGSSELRFGGSLAIGAASSARTGYELVIPENWDYGVDVWFTPKFEDGERMVVLKMGDLITLEIDKNDGATCTFKGDPSGDPVVLFSRSKPDNFNKSWRMVACFVHRGEARIWNMERPAIHFRNASPTAERVVNVEIGTAESVGDHTQLKPFTGELHLLRAWTNTQWMMDIVEDELRFVGLSPLD